MKKHYFINFILISFLCLDLAFMVVISTGNTFQVNAEDIAKTTSEEDSLGEYVNTLGEEDSLGEYVNTQSEEDSLAEMEQMGAWNENVTEMQESSQVDEFQENAEPESLPYLLSRSSSSGEANKLILNSAVQDFSTAVNNLDTEAAEDSLAAVSSAILKKKADSLSVENASDCSSKDADTNADVDIETNAEINADTKRNTKTNTNVDADTNADADTNTKSNADTNTKSNADTKTNVDVNAVTNTDTNATVNTNTNADISSDTGTVSATDEKAEHEIEVIDGVTYIDGILIVNKTYSLPETYNPGGLLPEVKEAFAKMQKAAAEEGLKIYISSGFRTYKRQVSLYNKYLKRDGEEKADTYSARPGYSEHQTGLSIDLNSISDSFSDTAESKWVSEHAHEYGFIVRFPEGKEEETGYKYESWHLRYIGVEKATEVYESGLCLEEFLGISSAYVD